MDRPAHILIVDDDREIRTLLRDYLSRNGFRATAVADGRAMMGALASSSGTPATDLVILDLMLPGEDGLSLCRRLRAQSTLPIIMLTARGDEMDRIVGLELGADDYIAKPFSPRELLARIHAVLRRVQTPHGGASARTSGADGGLQIFAGWTLDPVRRELTDPDGVVVSLSSGEYRLLTVFLANPNRVLSRDRLLDLTQGREALPFDRSIDVQVGRLRRRLHDDAQDPTLIKTIRGEGYVLSTSVTEQNHGLDSNPGASQ